MQTETCLGTPAHFPVRANCFIEDTLSNLWRLPDLTKILAVSGSLRMENSDTAKLLNPFLKGAEKAGIQLVKNGKIKEETLKTISEPLITEKELRQRYNSEYKKAQTQKLHFSQ